MAKKKRGEISPESGAEPADEKEAIDAESAAVDNGTEDSVKAQESPKPGLNPGSGGDYRFEDGQHIKVR